MRGDNEAAPEPPRRVSPRTTTQGRAPEQVNEITGANPSGLGRYFQTMSRRPTRTRQTSENSNNNKTNGSKKRKDKDEDNVDDGKRKQGKKRRKRESKGRGKRRTPWDTINWNPRRQGGVPPEQDFGDEVPEKPPGVLRWVYGNVDGFETLGHENHKSATIKRFLRKYEADGVSGVEPNIDWRQMPRAGKLPQLFKSQEALRTVVSFNEHEGHSRRQWGGSFSMAFGALAAGVADRGKDPSLLGRWSWIKFEGRNNHVCRVVTAYNPCTAPPENYTSVYQQQKRYWESKDINTCPREKFLQDPRAQLKKWRGAGERIVLFMDANQNVLKGRLSNMLAEEGIDMREAITGLHPDLPATATFKKGNRIGRNPIDGCWVTPEIELLRGTWLAFYKCPGDHQCAVADFNWRMLLGENKLKIVRPLARRLNNKIEGCGPLY